MTKIKVDLKEERKTTEVVLQRLMSLANPLDIEYIFPKLAHIAAIILSLSISNASHVLTNYAASSTRGPFIDTCNSPESMLSFSLLRRRVLIRLRAEQKTK
jgi:hypothetical protein